MVFSILESGSDELDIVLRCLDTLRGFLLKAVQRIDRRSQAEAQMYTHISISPMDGTYRKARGLPGLFALHRHQSLSLLFNAFNVVMMLELVAFNWATRVSIAVYLAVSVVVRLAVRLVRAS